MEEHPIDAALEEAVAALIALGDALGPRSPWDVWRAQQGHPVLDAGPADVAGWLRAVAGPSRARGDRRGPRCRRRRTRGHGGRRVQTSPMDTVQWTRALGRYAEQLHAKAGDGHHVVSPLGAWMVVALCAPAAEWERDREALARALGADPGAAFRLAATLLSAPHPLVAAAGGLWLRSGFETPGFKSWLEALPQAVTTGDLPSQADLDDWADDHTAGLIKRFPIEITPTVVCLLASALATRVSWEVPFDVVSAAELGEGPWSHGLGSALRAPRGDPRHRQFLAATEGAGTGASTSPRPAAACWSAR